MPGLLARESEMWWGTPAQLTTSPATWTDSLFGSVNKGGDRVQVANGAGLAISHIGNSTISGSCRSLKLNDILHVPNISKHLLSTHKLALDNDAFF